MSLFSQKNLAELIPDKLREYRLQYSTIPNYITDNLRYTLFKWQQDALLNFFDYLAIREQEDDNNPVHLLFNMATGTGKTLLMAALILYYFKQGRRKFIFFVNQNNIVGKTEENLTNPLHNKYLFTQNVLIDGKSIHVKKVDTFSDYDDDVQILFTTIHSLHNSVYKIREDSIFLEQLQKDDIIMLADEAHHLNVDTKKKKNDQFELELATELNEGASQLLIEKSWEHTVIQLILKKGRKSQHKPNNSVLLEFTATVPSNEMVIEKYLPITVFKYDLKDFIKAGYTKEINLVSSSFDKRKRILQALLFNWYRNEIALKYGVPNFKPVILFRSKYIDKAQENNSQQDYDLFCSLIRDLTIEDFQFLNDFDEKSLFNVTDLYQKGQSRIIDIKRYLIESKKTVSNIITYLKGAFNERNCVITNSQKGTKSIEKTEAITEKLLNSLEDKNNHIRAIFTVQRLTEGWDVLNLYDIVRLYEGQNTGGTNKGKSGSATTSEVQLIGRGVRYYPFEFEGKEKTKRKFDGQLNHELRVLEEFYFHSDNNEKYLSDLKNELKRNEWLPQNDKIIKKYQLKEKFIEDNYEFYNSLKLFSNNQIDNPDRYKASLDEIRNSFNFSYTFESLSVNETSINFGKDKDNTRFNTANYDNTTEFRKLKDFDLHIIRKALNISSSRENSILRINRLKQELLITSIDDLLNNNFLGLFLIKLVYPKNTTFDEISNYEKLQCLTKFFEAIALELENFSSPYIGSDFFPISFKDMGKWYKEKAITEEPLNKKLEDLLKEKPWYIYNGFSGTSEERNLVQFLSEIMGNLEMKYEKVFLLRNEEIYKIYDFEKGRGFQPDFLLFLKFSNVNLYYQVFIEPKGSQFEDSIGGFSSGKEGWKDTFLKSITEKYGVNKVFRLENKDYELYGMPLYNAKNTNEFEESLYSNLKIDVLN